jgi:hypothetical protein
MVIPLEVPDSRHLANWRSSADEMTSDEFTTDVNFRSVLQAYRIAAPRCDEVTGKQAGKVNEMEPVV